MTASAGGPGWCRSPPWSRRSRATRAAELLSASSDMYRAGFLRIRRSHLVQPRNVKPAPAHSFSSLWLSFSLIRPAGSVSLFTAWQRLDPLWWTMAMPAGLCEGVAFFVQVSEETCEPYGDAVVGIGWCVVLGFSGIIRSRLE